MNPIFIPEIRVGNTDCWTARLNGPNFEYDPRHVYVTLESLCETLKRPEMQQQMTMLSLNTKGLSRRETQILFTVLWENLHQLTKLSVWLQPNQIDDSYTAFVIAEAIRRKRLTLQCLNVSCEGAIWDERHFEQMLEADSSELPVFSPTVDPENPNGPLWPVLTNLQITATVTNMTMEAMANIAAWLNHTPQLNRLTMLLKPGEGSIYGDNMAFSTQDVINTGMFAAIGKLPRLQTFYYDDDCNLSGPKILQVVAHDVLTPRADSLESLLVSTCEFARLEPLATPMHALEQHSLNEDPSPIGVFFNALSKCHQLYSVFVIGGLMHTNGSSRFEVYAEAARITIQSAHVGPIRFKAEKCHKCNAEDSD